MILQTLRTSKASAGDTCTTAKLRRARRWGNNFEQKRGHGEFIWPSVCIQESQGGNMDFFDCSIYAKYWSGLRRNERREGTASTIKRCFLDGVYHGSKQYRPSLPHGSLRFICAVRSCSEASLLWASGKGSDHVERRPMSRTRYMAPPCQSSCRIASTCAFSKSQG